MALLADYTAGTISVSADATEVIGTGTAWLTAGFREGDWLIANGWVNIVASVSAEGTLTLAQPWRGGTLSESPYRLRYMSDGSRASAQARQLIDLLGGSGSLEALAALTGTPNTIPYFTGAGTMGLLSRQDLTQGVQFDVQVDALSDRDDYDEEQVGFSVLVADAGDGRAALYSREGEPGNWSAPAYITGPEGEVGPEWLAWEGAWSAGTYAAGDGVEHNGSTYRANTETSEEPPHADWDLVSQKGDIGPEWIDWQGDWSAGTYTAGQGVKHDGAAYRANTETSAEPPHGDWDLVVERGGKGEQGDPGLKPVQVDELSDRDAYDDEDEGFSVLVSDTGDGRAAIYSKNSNASADWSDPAYVTGPSGASAAEDVSYDNAVSGLDATDVQAAVDELAGLPFYLPSNILGTVSQSGGVPTGAIIERGSNANGDYIKYADGTQICWHRMDGGVTSGTTGNVHYIPSAVVWTFPAAFVGTYSVSGRVNRRVGVLGAGWLADVGQTDTANYVQLWIVASTSNFEGDIEAMAIGRWF